MGEATAILEQTNFTAFDWVIVLMYPFVSVLIGLYVRKFITNMKDFVVAGQGLGVCLGIATMTGTELGLITVMYSAEKGFRGGFAAFHIALTAGIVTFFVGLTGFIVYRLRAMRVLTIPEFYERRFDRKTRIVGGIMMALGGILNMGLFLQVGSMFIVGITGMSEISWALPAVMVFLITLVLIYTCLGGMISVVVADYVQFVVLSFGLLLTTLLAIREIGWSRIFETVQVEMGVRGFDPTVAEGHFGWEYIIWMGFMGLVICGVWPTSVARALAMESPQAVKRQYMFASISYLIRFLIPYFWGICAFVFVMHDEALRNVFFPAGYPPPDPVAGAAEPLVDGLYAMPVFLGRIVPAGVIGVITAGMVAAFMSTHDSYLLCWSTVLTQDVVAPLYEKGDRRLSPKARITLTRLFIVVIGLYVLYWGLIYRGEDDVWDYMAVTGAIYFSGAFALLSCGLYWKRASSAGAMLALLTGFVAVLGLSPVQAGIEQLLNGLAGQSPERLQWLAWIPGAAAVDVNVDGETLRALAFQIPSERVGLVSVGGTIIAMIAGSLLLPDRGKSDQPASGGGESL